MSSNPEPLQPAPNNPRPLSADELLPPIEPPSAGFILQLFVVPAVIVAIVVFLGWVVTSLATSGQRDPGEIVAKLRSSNQDRWIEAFELANAMRTDNEKGGLRENTQLADELAKLLDDEFKAEGEDDNSIRLRTYLAATLGAFRVDNGLDELLKVAANDKDLEVRRKAINAIAILADSFGSEDPPRPLGDEKLVETFVELANNENDVIRTETAFALGVLVLLPNADPRLNEELDKLVDDLYPYARLNAATALARQGKLRAVAPLAEMLDLESLSESVKTDKDPTVQTTNRNQILKVSLDAAETLKKKNPAADLSELETALEKFIAEAPAWTKQGKIPPQLVDRARNVLEPFEKN